LTHGAYALTCDFDYSYGYALSPDVSARSAEYQQFAIVHFQNAASDLYVTVVKR
jgi:hypothetical protein